MAVVTGTSSRPTFTDMYVCWHVSHANATAVNRLSTQRRRRKRSVYILINIERNTHTRALTRRTHTPFQLAVCDSSCKHARVKYADRCAPRMPSRKNRVLYFFPFVDQKPKWWFFIRRDTTTDPSSWTPRRAHLLDWLGLWSTATVVDAIFWLGRRWLAAIAAHVKP